MEGDGESLQEAVEGLIDPNFPDVVEAEILGPNSNHAPSVAKMVVSVMHLKRVPIADDLQ